MLSDRAEKAIGIAVAAVGLAVVCFVIASLLQSPDGTDDLDTADSDTTIGSEEPAPTTTDSTDTTSPPTTEAPTTTVRQPVVHLSPAGDDGQNGQTPDTAVRTIERALALSQPGDDILFGPGVYPPVTIQNVDGLRFAPSDEAAETLFTADSYDVGPGIHLVDSTNIEISGLSVSRVLWGVMVEGSSGVLVDGLTVFDVGQEGIMVRTESNDVTVSNNTVFDTGNRPGGNDEFPFTTFGEGIYLGTGGVKADGTVDTTFDVRVIGNEIYDTTAEAIDIKPSVSQVLVAENIVRDVSTTTSGAIVVGIGTRVSPDPQVVIERNVIFNVTRTSRFRDGNAITVSAPAIVRANVIWGTEHYGIRIDENVLSANGGVVVVENNLIGNTGLDPVSVAQIAAGVEIQVGENFFEVPIESYLDPASPTAVTDALAQTVLLEAGTFIPTTGS